MARDAWITARRRAWSTLLTAYTGGCVIDLATYDPPCLLVPAGHDTTVAG